MPNSPKSSTANQLLLQPASSRPRRIPAKVEVEVPTGTNPAGAKPLGDVSPRARLVIVSLRAVSNRTEPPHPKPSALGAYSSIFRSHLSQELLKEPYIQEPCIQDNSEEVSSTVLPINKFPVKSQDTNTSTNPVRCLHTKASSGLPSRGMAFSVRQKVGGGMRKLPRFRGSSAQSFLVLPGQTSTPSRTGLLCQVRQETCRDSLPCQRDAAQKRSGACLLFRHTAITAICFWSQR